MDVHDPHVVALADPLAVGGLGHGDAVGGRQDEAEQEEERQPDEGQRAQHPRALGGGRGVHGAPPAQSRSPLPGKSGPGFPGPGQESSNRMPKVAAPRPRYEVVKATSRRSHAPPLAGGAGEGGVDRLGGAQQQRGEGRQHQQREQRRGHPLADREHAVEAADGGQAQRRHDDRGHQEGRRAEGGVVEGDDAQQQEQVEHQQLERHRGDLAQEDARRVEAGQAEGVAQPVGRLQREGPLDGEEPREQDGDPEQARRPLPQHAGGRVEGEGEQQQDQHREGGDLVHRHPGPGLDAQVLAGDEPGVAPDGREVRHGAPPARGRPRPRPGGGPPAEPAPARATTAARSPRRRRRRRSARRPDPAPPGRARRGARRAATAPGRRDTRTASEVRRRWPAESWPTGTSRSRPARPRRSRAASTSAPSAPAAAAQKRTLASTVRSS